MDRFRLSIVDGFSGGGAYTHEKTKEVIPGSPIILLSAIEAAIAQINLDRTKKIQFDIEYFFCDKDGAAINYLRHELENQGYAARIDESIFLVIGEFGQKCDDIIRKIKRPKPFANRAIFLLDQYAYKDVPLNKLRHIFHELPNAEVLLTFGIDQLVTYLSDNKGFDTALRRLEISQSEREYLRTLKTSDRNWRKLTQQLLHGHLAKQSHSQFYTPFFIRSAKSSRAYWFIHLSQHQRARDEMVKLHWSESNHFSHYGGAGLEMLGFDPTKNADPNQAELEFGFDDSALSRSKNALLRDLPRRIYGYDEGITFQNLCASISNETPATNATIEETLLELKSEGEIQIIDGSGNTREVRKHIKKGHLLIPAKQLLFPTFQRDK